MSDFDLSKITGKEGPLPTDEDLHGLCADIMKAEIVSLKVALDVLCDAASAVVSYEDINYGGGNDHVISRLRDALSQARKVGGSGCQRSGNG